MLSRITMSTKSSARAALDWLRFLMTGRVVEGGGETLRRESPYGGQQVTTAAFWASGQQLLLLGAEIAVDCPVRLIHGEADPDVPVEIAMRTMGALRSADVQLQIIKGGGHRLSEPREIATTIRTVAQTLEPAA